MPDDSSGKRPGFRSVQQPSVHKTPEDLFYKLSGRSSTHGYLRGPQQDVLREYAGEHIKDQDIAFELPTGTGKTAVGLLISEWKRLSGHRVAYLSLTNQLTAQVLLEAKRLGVASADLRGTKETRDSAEEGRFRTHAAIGVTTYSNLFNVNPIIQECDLLVFDDAHGAEQYVADMWTISVKRPVHGGLYTSMLADLRAGLTDSQLQAVTDPSEATHVEMVDIVGHPECLAAVSTTLNLATQDMIRFPWRLIRLKLRACVFLVSWAEITIRPLIPPTHTHLPFATAGQRIYMSATLGGEGDLRRAYGISSLKMVRAKSPQWGRRYVFVPGVYASEDRANQVTASIWDSIMPRRAVLLAPSDRTMKRTFEALASHVTNMPTQYGADDIANSVDAFVNADDSMLTLGGRYDGLDLPDEQCRLLLMCESPAAINPLERHLSERWKLGPVLRKRERTRLIQGMGRCTRNATDFAIIVWLGQSLVNAATSSALLAGMPSELAREIKWGLRQSELMAKNPGDFVNMVLGLLDDASYRREADEDIEAVNAPEPISDPDQYEELGTNEVNFAKAIWDENYQRAFESARKIVDQATAPELAGYRAWWWFLTSVAASLLGNATAEKDALQRSVYCGVNAGWTNRILRDRGSSPAAVSPTDVEANAQCVWDLIDNWGWAGPTFEQRITHMQEQLKTQYHKAFHEGVESLGKCLGAQTIRTTEDGAPDVVWTFANDVHIAFEAKTEKKSNGTLSKKDLQETKGHADWVRARLHNGETTAVIETVTVSEDPTVHQIALPFTTGVFHVTPNELAVLAKQVVEVLRNVRIKFSGRDFADSAAEVSSDLRNNRMGVKAIIQTLTANPLKK